jgi:hypothetical protein
LSGEIPQVLAQVIGSLNFLCAEFFGNAAVLIEVIRQRSNRLQDVQLPRKLGCKGSSLCRADTAAPGAREERVSRRSVPSEANGKVATTLNLIAQAKAMRKWKNSHQASVKRDVAVGRDTARKMGPET